jgi:hypothetical protein
MPLPLIALVGAAIKAANKPEQKQVVAKSKRKSGPKAKARAATAGSR